MNNSFFDEYGEKIEDTLNEQYFITDFNQEINETNFHVYGLAGDWGTGKTSFIKMWKDNLNKDKISIILIDAFENDYIQNPFTMIYSAFKSFMKENGIKKKDAEPIVKKAKKIAFNSLKAAGKVGINFLIDKIGEENTEQFISSFSDSLFDEFDYNPRKKEENLCKELKVLLKSMVKKTKKNVYIVIDELDRCRPDFALETLEKVKHLFAIDGVKFLLVYNPDIISAMVKNKYGIDDKNRYIKKFIEREITFDPSNVYINWLRNEAKLFAERGINPAICHFISEFAPNISKLMQIYRLSLRDTQRILTTIECRTLFTDENYNLSFGTTIAFYKAININEYNDMIKYLQKNDGMFKIDAPKKNDYITIASIITKSDTTIDYESLFITYFQNYYYQQR